MGLLAVSIGLAPDKPSFVGAWKLNVTQSDFGSESAPKSMGATTKIDTPQKLSYRVHGVDDKEKAFSYSWSGPQDGSMHPIMVNGKPAGRQGVKREQDTLVRHGEDSTDGSSFDARTQLSADGNTITGEKTDTSYVRYLFPSWAIDDPVGNRSMVVPRTNQPAKLARLVENGTTAHPPNEVRLHLEARKRKQRAVA